jgi:hypothetical protein
MLVFFKSFVTTDMKFFLVHYPTFPDFDPQNENKRIPVKFQICRKHPFWNSITVRLLINVPSSIRFLRVNGIIKRSNILMSQRKGIRYISKNAQTHFCFLHSQEIFHRLSLNMKKRKKSFEMDWNLYDHLRWVCTLCRIFHTIKKNEEGIRASRLHAIEWYESIFYRKKFTASRLNFEIKYSR